MIVKIPFSNASLNRNIGCEKAPDKIIDNLDESIKKYKKIIEIKIDKNNIKESQEEIYKKSKEILNVNKNKNKKIVFLGGDHSITYPITKSFSEVYKNPGLLIFDAHPDCDFYIKEPTHEDWLRKLIDDKIIKTSNILLIGIRDYGINEINFLKKNNIQYFNMNKFIEFNMITFTDIIMEKIKDWDIYISFDIDVIDPAFAPATGCPSPGGFMPREIFYIFNRLRYIKNIKAIDFVEYNPEKHKSNGTLNIISNIISILK